MDNLLNPQFISIPPKPKRRYYESAHHYRNDLKKHQQTYYPLDYLIEHGMRRFEDEKPREGEFYVDAGDGKWFYLSEYNQAKKKQDQHGRLRGEWVALEYISNRASHIFTNEELNLRIVLNENGETWFIIHEINGLLMSIEAKYATYEMVNNFLEMYSSELTASKVREGME